MYQLRSIGLSIIAMTFSISAQAQNTFNLPDPGTMITLSVPYKPAIVKGMTIYPDNPLKFDFIVDPGDDNLQNAGLRDEANKLIKYFMASLTVPQDEMWVNLSPYEKDRIIADGLSKTALGRDLLSQDYILKQVTASLMYPEEKLGEDFWQRVYAKIYDQYGTHDIPINTFNKVWIIPDKADVHVRGNNVFVVNNHLKVMLEEDYLSLENNLGHNNHGIGKIPQGQVKDVSEVSKEVIREILIPEIEKEVNQGKNFAPLRQIVNSMILATWYKQRLKESLLGQVYVNQNKVNGIKVEDKQFKEKIYNQYVKAFEEGVYNYIKDEYDQAMHEIIPRKYFSGGIRGPEEIFDNAMPITPKELFNENEKIFSVTAQPIITNASGDDSVSIAEAIISLTQQFETIDGVEEFIKRSQQEVLSASDFSPQALEVLEDLPLIFGFESGEGAMIYDDERDKRLYRNVQISDKDAAIVRSVLYDPENFKSHKDIFSVKLDLLYILRELLGTNLDIKTRIKFEMSSLVKLHKSLAKLKGINLEDIPFDAQTIIDGILEEKAQFAKDPIPLFDDLLGFNIIIDDHGFTDDERNSAMNNAVDRVVRILQDEKNLNVTVVQKESRVKGYNYANIFIQGLLEHNDLGSLPVKIQFRTSKIIEHETAMRYIYKKNGKWEYPPWITRADVEAVGSAKELREKLFTGFKDYTKDMRVKTPFRLDDHIRQLEIPKELQYLTMPIKQQERTKEFVIESPDKIALLITAPQKQGSRIEELRSKMGAASLDDRTLTKLNEVRAEKIANGSHPMKIRVINEQMNIALTLRAFTRSLDKDSVISRYLNDLADTIELYALEDLQPYSTALLFILGSQLHGSDISDSLKEMYDAYLNGYKQPHVDTKLGESISPIAKGRLDDVTEKTTDLIVNQLLRIETEDFSLAVNTSGDQMNTEEVGGIDLNPGNLNLNITGDEIRIDFPNFPIDSTLVNGFIPVIVNIAPLDISKYSGN